MKRAPLHATLIAAALLPWYGRVAAQQFWRPDERVVISDFTRVAAITADAWRVMAATENGLIIFDPAAQRWELPLTAEDGYPVLERPTSLAWIEGAHTLLLGTWTGSLWRVDVEGRRLERLAQLPGTIVTIRDAPDGSAWLGTNGGWFRLPAGSFMVEPAGAPPPLRNADDPFLEAMRGQLGLDRTLHRWRVTGQVAGRLPGEYFIGTDGGGIARVDTRMQSVEWLPYGITTRGGGAVALVGGRLWFGGDGSGRQDVSLVSATPALQEWLAAIDRDAPRGAVSAIVPQERYAWVATSQGLYRYESASAQWRRFDERHGLPSETVHALRADGAALWIATSRGLCRFDGEQCSANVLPAQPVFAIASCQGTLWAAARNGLFAVDATNAAVPVTLPRTRTRVQDVACTDEGVYAATGTEVFVLRAGSWAEAAMPRPAGTLLRLVGDGSVLWLGADRWVGRWDAASRHWSQYIVPSDVPDGPVRGILPLDSALWLVTAGGIMRLDRQQR